MFVQYLSVFKCILFSVANITVKLFVDTNFLTYSGRLVFPQKARLNPVVDRAVGRLTF